MAEKLKVVALADFYDRAVGASRKKGDVFEVAPKRLEQLNACGPEQCGKPLAEAVEAPKRDARKPRE